MFGNKTPLYHRIRLDEKPNFGTLRGMLNIQLKALEETIAAAGKDFADGEFVIAVRPVGLPDDQQWDVLTSWGERA